MKPAVTDLALFGGRPEFSEKLHVGRPNLGDRQAFLERVNGILDRRWFTNTGPQVAEFEGRVAQISGAKHCIAMCNGTVALEIATRALELKGEVIVPSFTFVATAHALQWQKITPVFCDIDPRTHNIDPAVVESLITPRTTGIMGVHLWGRPCNTDALQEIASRRGLRLIYDAAHAFGCSDAGRPIGQFGAASVLSFHATKVVSTFEGGAVLTSDDQLAEKIRFMKNFGFSYYDEVSHLGVNGKMSEVSAAMGLCGLEAFADFVRVNARNQDLYRDGLAGVAGLSLVCHDPRHTPNYHYVVMEIDEDIFGLSRDVVYQALHAERVLVRRYFFPGCHRMEPYRSYYPHASLLLPQTEKLVRRVLVLPTGSGISKEEIGRVCLLLRALHRHAAEIRERLPSLPPLRGSR
jgi:dTDP-4-amino-4,6-dideoxygalactose transaminase